MPRLLPWVLLALLAHLPAPAAADLVCVGHPKDYAGELSVFRIDEQGRHLLARLAVPGFRLGDAPEIAWHPDGREFLLAVCDGYLESELYPTSWRSCRLPGVTSPC